MTTLDRKLLRDVAHLKGQVLAIALVLATGVAVMIVAVGAYRAIEETRAAYYERFRFAHVFADLERAPEGLAARVAAVRGVTGAVTRIVQTALLDIEGMSAPATGVVVSLPDTGEPQLNALYLRAGRLPEAYADDEVVINESFARAHGFAPGDRFTATLKGVRREFTIVGIGLSPEFVYALGPGDLVPDDRRFGVLWVRRHAVEAAVDMDGAFNNIVLRLSRGASEPRVLEQLDRLLAPYGGRAAYGRQDQTSHAFLDAELNQLRGLSRILPPIFLGVAAFLLNVTMSRLIAGEREVIGLLKALGFTSGSIAWHYLKLALLISGLGTALGVGAGWWLGRQLTELYANFYHFPFLYFPLRLDVFVIAAAASTAATLLGVLRSVLHAATLAPAVAMRPPAPIRYRRSWLDRLGFTRWLSQPTVMVLRHMMRHPLRAGLTTIGMALSVAVLVGSLFANDSVEAMIDVTFNQSYREDAFLVLSVPTSPAAVREVAAMPGVLRAEPNRQEMVLLRQGPRQRRISITGLPPDADLDQVLDTAHRRVALPQQGLLLTDKLAEILHVELGDLIDVTFLQGKQRSAQVRVVAIVESFLGLGAYMDLDALHRLTGDGPRVTSIDVAVDPAFDERFHQAVKDTPGVAAIGMLKTSLANFRLTLARNVNMTMSVYVTFATAIAFGVVYNSARVQLSERARELASLRVLGLTKGEVSWILLGELALLTLLSMPVGWLLGYALAWIIVEGLDSELYRVPFVISRRTFAEAGLVVAIAATLSGLAVRRRVNQLDLIAVLKVRE